MTTLKLLSAGLIAAAMFATPAMARDSHKSHVASRHRVEAVAPGCVSAPRVGAFATQPWGDGDTPCEPNSGYSYGYGYGY